MPAGETMPATSRRDAELQAFFLAMREAVGAGDHASEPGAKLYERIYAALAEPARPGAVTPGAVPACRHLPEAIAIAKRGPAAAARLARALEAIAPRLAWYRRPGTEALGSLFAEGHANAFIAGPKGLEQREDVWVGVSLMAPGVRYPDHDHPPEEVYAVLSQGEWRNEHDDWHEPGIGGVVHNPPGIVHAMRSGAQPLLAAWALWVG